MSVHCLSKVNNVALDHCQWRHSGVFIVDFEHKQFDLLFSSMNLNEHAHAPCNKISAELGTDCLKE